MTRSDLAWDRIDEAVDGLENAWQTEGDAELGSFLPPPDDPLYADVLVALVKIDQEHRWAADQPQPLEDYIERWPELSKDPAVLVDLLTAECRIRKSRNKFPARQEIEERFPALVDRIDLACISTAEEQPFDDEISQLFSRLIEGSLGANSVEEAAILPPGAELGHYEVVGLLGRGGMGTVYLAQDTRLERLAAVKLIHASLFPTQDALSLLLHDARASAKLKHPGIVTVYEVSETDDSQPFLAMEHVSGSSLGDQIARGNVSQTSAVETTLQVAEALQFAHQRGIIHRDIKPANILVDEQHVARLTDFGLAYQEEKSDAKNDALSGTLPYMAPEQFALEAQRPDGRTDIWALGVVFYEMLSGQRPFQSKTFAGFRELITCQDPKPLRQINEAIPEPLSRICAKCLAKDPAQRYQAAADVAADLRKWQGRQGGSRRTLLGVGMTAVVLLMAAIAWMAGWPGTRPPDSGDGPLTLAGGSSDSTLVAYYPFDGDAQDYSGNGHHGRIHDAVPCADRRGRADGAYCLGGADSYIDSIPVEAIPSTMTFAAWVCPNETGGQLWGTIEDASGGKDSFYADLRPDTPYFAYVKDNRDKGEAGGPAGAVPVGEWSHVVYTLSADSVFNLYVNGKHVGRGRFLTTVDAHDRSLMIGKTIRSQGHSFAGAIDDVRIYSRALSEDEVRDLYEDEK